MQPPLFFELTGGTLGGGKSITGGQLPVTRKQEQGKRKEEKGKRIHKLEKGNRIR